MARSFTIPRTNFLSLPSTMFVPLPQYKFWLQFLNEYSFVATALTARTQLVHDALRVVCRTAVNSSNQDILSFTFQLNGRSILVTEHDLNLILGFLVDNFASELEAVDVTNFLLSISYQGELVQGELYKNRFPKEWNFFFHTLSHVFTANKYGFHGINMPIQLLRCAVANKIHMNYGKWLMKNIIHNLNPRVPRDFDNSHVVCLFPMIIQFILDDMLTEQELESFLKAKLLSPQKSSLTP